MRVLITGATGMLGTSLCDCFLRQGHDVYGLSRGNRVREPFSKEHRIEADITDRKRIRQITQEIHPELILHSAAISDVDYCEKVTQEAYRINGEGTRTLAEATDVCQARFCYISTDYVFDGENPSPYREEDPCRPLNVYGKSKLQGEEHTRAVCKHYVIIRTSWLFGENQDSFVHHVLEWAKTKTEIRLVSDKWSTPTYTPDLASSIYQLLDKGVPSGIYHVANGGVGCSWFDYGEKILAYRGLNHVPLIPMHLEALKRPAKRPPRSILSLEKFSKATGKEIRPWQEALKEYLTTVYTVPSKR